MGGLGMGGMWGAGGFPFTQGLFGGLMGQFGMGGVCFALHGCRFRMGGLGFGAGIGGFGGRTIFGLNDQQMKSDSNAV
ncbi:hypothetical protein DFH28DRAFT_190498 [Melampsora americana]|nr:hypothetical protein DFH28DRAFT_190498 [Melampsora americana]